MGEDARQGSLQAGRKDWTPSTHLPSLDVHGDQLQSYGPQDGSCTQFYKDTLFGLEGELKGWDKWEFLRWMGTRLAFSAFVGITDALAQGNLSLGSHWAGG